jgi:dimethylamine/trimethylamine dehydrogenase
VTLADKASAAGGRVAQESRLPGLAEWGRVADHRLYQISQMPNVDLYLESRITPDMISEFGADHVALATGARWSSDGIGRQNPLGIQTAKNTQVLTPDDVMAGTVPTGPVVLFDDDHFYMGGAIAEKLRRDGCDVTLVTPASEVSSWTHNTLDQHAIQKQLLELGVTILTAQNLARLRPGEADIECIYTGTARTIPCATAVLVTMRRPVDTLWQVVPDATRIGDLLGPSTIAAAVYSGHQYARGLGTPSPDTLPFRRELVERAPPCEETTR